MHSNFSAYSIFSYSISVRVLQLLEGRTTTLFPMLFNADPRPFKKVQYTVLYFLVKPVKSPVFTGKFQYSCLIPFLLMSRHTCDRHKNMYQLEYNGRQPGQATDKITCYYTITFISHTTDLQF